MAVYSICYQNKQVPIAARNIREAAKIACYSLMPPDGAPVSVRRDVSGKTRDYCRWRGQVWPYNMLATVKKMNQHKENAPL